MDGFAPDLDKYRPDQPISGQIATDASHLRPRPSNQILTHEHLRRRRPGARECKCGPTWQTSYSNNSLGPTHRNTDPAFPRVSNLSKQLDKPYCKNLFCKNSTAALEALAFAQLRVLTPPTPIFVISARSDLNASGVAFATLLRSRSLDDHILSMTSVMSVRTYFGF